MEGLNLAMVPQGYCANLSITSNLYVQVIATQKVHPHVKHICQRLLVEMSNSSTSVKMTKECFGSLGHSKTFWAEEANSGCVWMWYLPEGQVRSFVACWSTSTSGYSWMEIGGHSMDFIVGLPMTQHKHDSIWVIVDRFSKFAHFIPVNARYNMKKYAELYISWIVHLHGVPKTFVSDKGSQFTLGSESICRVL